MKKYLILSAVAVGLISAGALAFTAEGKGVVQRFGLFSPLLFIKGIYVGPELGANAVTLNTDNKTTAIRHLNYDWDFAAIPAQAASGSGGVLASGTIAWAGVKVGDDCTVSAKAYYDGGIPPDVFFRCFIIAPNGVVLYAHALVTDGGAPNATDSGFMFTSHSNQAQ